MYESDDKMVSHPSHYQSETGLEVIDEYYVAAEPPVRCGVSHLSGLTEPLI